MKHEGRPAVIFAERFCLRFKGCFMKSGTVKWFSDAKGYGFIIPDGETCDVFVHFRAIEMQGRKTLQNNQRVEFEFEESERGPHATRVVPSPTKASAPS